MAMLKLSLAGPVVATKAVTHSAFFMDQEASSPTGNGGRGGLFFTHGLHSTRKFRWCSGALAGAGLTGSLLGQ
jgi:hypothetical protein